MKTVGHRVLFLGDVAVGETPFVLPDELKSFDKIVFNLEGPISDHKQISAVYSFSEALFHNGVEQYMDLACLANNHITDIPSLFLNTLDALEKANIGYVGGGASAADAEKPYVMSCNGSTIVFLNYGWSVIRCREAGSNSPGVNIINRSKILNDIRIHSSEPLSIVVVIFHWNYELEGFPQPADRNLARECVDAGASAIIGGHSHLACGAEKYDDCPVVYGLGNWFFPPTHFGETFVKFPEKSKLQLAFELEILEDKVVGSKFHWFHFDQDSSRLRFQCSESWGGHVIDSLTPYAKMDSVQYYEWFRINRYKRKMLPIYRNYANNFEVTVKDALNVVRDLVLKCAIRFKLKGGYS